MNLSQMPLKKAFFPTLGLVGLSIHTFAATIGSDNASATAYDDGWDNGDNGGSAFQPWTLTTQSGGGAAGFFIGDSTNLGGPGADINTAGESFGMFGQTPSFTEAKATRFFDSDLSIGQTFSIELAVNFRNGSKGIDILDSGSQNIFNFNTGADDYVVSNAATGNGSVGDAYDENTSFLLELTQFDGTGGTWIITRGGTISGEVGSGTYNGVASGFALYVLDTDTGNSANDFYANSMQIVPEPQTYAIIAGMATLTLALLRRRQT